MVVGHTGTFQRSERVSVFLGVWVGSLWGAALSLCTPEGGVGAGRRQLGPGGEMCRHCVVVLFFQRCLQKRQNLDWVPGPCPGLSLASRRGGEAAGWRVDRKPGLVRAPSWVPVGGLASENHLKLSRSF